MLLQWVAGGLLQFGYHISCNPLHSIHIVQKGLGLDAPALVGWVVAN